MPVLLLVGVARDALRRSGPEPRVAIGGWNVEVFASSMKGVSTGTCWPAVMSRIAIIDSNVEADGVHVFGFDRNERDFNDLRKTIRDHHRMRQLPNQMMQYYRTDQFNAELTDYVSREEFWRSNLRPSDLNEPVILPENFFVTEEPYSALWKRVRDFDDTSPEKLSAVRSLIATFKTRHEPRYRDIAGFRFDSGGPRHGFDREPMRNWKFGFRLPNSFHFDVDHQQLKPFWLACRDQERRKYNTHCNMDAFGWEVGG